MAIDPTSRGFGFAVLEGPETLIDWGAPGARASERELVLARVEDLLERYRPDLLVVEDVGSRHARRCRRVVELLATIRNTALVRGVRSEAISIRRVREAFSDDGRATKARIAAAVADHFPELGVHLPPTRKPWMSEDVRMSLFDAAALGLTYYLHD